MDLLGREFATGISGALFKRHFCRGSNAAFTMSTPKQQIREVWANNLETEMEIIRELLPKYPFVAMVRCLMIHHLLRKIRILNFLDSWLGLLVLSGHSLNSFTRPFDATLICSKLFSSVSRWLMKRETFHRMSALGSSISNSISSNTFWVCVIFPKNIFSSDTYSQESIDLLTSCGIEFDRFNRDGMDSAQFGELLVTSGLVLMPNVKWITFHSGYDFGYLLKVLMANPLPADEGTFFELLRLFFPSFYDIKYLMKTCKSLKGGLQDIADDLGIARIGIQHQAGSDSLLTAKAFFKIRHVFFEDHMDDTKYSGFLFGLGIEPAYNLTGKIAGSGTLTPSASTSDVHIGNTPPSSTVSY